MTGKQVKTCSKRMKNCSKGLRTRLKTGLNKTNVQMGLSESDLKKRLINKRRIVKQKLEFLKHGEMTKEKLFLPITKHLKEIGNKLQNESGNHNKKINDLETEKGSIKNETSNFFKEDEELSRIPLQPSKLESNSMTTPKLSRFLSEQLSSPLNRISLLQDENEDPSADKLTLIDEVNHENSPSTSAGRTPSQSKFTDIAEQSYIDYLEQYDPLPRRYISGIYSDDVNKEYDHKYGVRLDTLTEKLMIGDSRMDIEGPDIIIKKKRYRGTHGLYELLFKKKPKNFTREDAENYKQIVVKTNAHRRHYKSNKQIDGSKLRKYKRIIAPMVSGKGILMEVDENKIDYVHWDDPNELVERLRLLLASVSAGHTNHINEINSIVEELRESQVIV